MPRRLLARPKTPPGELEPRLPLERRRRYAFPLGHRNRRSAECVAWRHRRTATPAAKGGIWLQSAAPGELDSLFVNGRRRSVNRKAEWILTAYRVDFGGLWWTNRPPAMSGLNSKTTLADFSGRPTLCLAVRRSGVRIPSGPPPHYLVACREFRVGQLCGFRGPAKRSANPSKANANSSRRTM